MEFLKNWKGRFLLLLLLLHLGWVCIHMSVHARGELNPWKLGGYAMYVQPSKFLEVRLFSLDQNREYTIPVTANMSGFLRSNWDMNYYCKTPSARSIHTLFTQNSHLIGIDMELQFYAYHFDRTELEMRESQISLIEVIWQDNTQLTYTGTICGAVLPQRSLTF